MKLSNLSLHRRRFLRWTGTSLGLVSSYLSGCASLLTPKFTPRPFEAVSCQQTNEATAFDYIVVGSGAGGGPVAANLALAGYRVLLLEAGGDDEPTNYQVPGFHACASEDEKLRWDFYVRHYSDDQQQKQDEKFTPLADGVLYPRSGTLGGCTAHHAMIIVYPHNRDWDYIATLTRDRSWTSDNMRKYFERLERCVYADSNDTKSRHGFKGWLTTTLADPKLMDRDPQIWELTIAAVKESLWSLGRPLTRIWTRIRGHFDPNDWRIVKQNSEGICKVPLSVHEGKRLGTREYIRRVQSACPNNLIVKTQALVTRVILDDDRVARGVEYLAGAHLYKADPNYTAKQRGEKQAVHCKREVILAAGAFNTPQILMLSGIGPEDELDRHGIKVRVNLPGVGKNLQDRYEIGVLTKLKNDLKLMEGMKFCPIQPGDPPDPQYVEWQTQHTGPYTTNGALIAMIKRSMPERVDPDLFIFGLLGKFKGYFPGYSRQINQDRYFTWAILKAHTRNNGGTVKLRSADPQDTPEINFHYFHEGTDQQSEDLKSVVKGIETVRNIIQRCGDLIEEEVLPGSGVQSQEQLEKFIKDNAWGHHASCTCRMGPASDDNAVVDSCFRVRNVKNLRIVDASVFPKIPGFFIVTAIYMISEKATDVIIEDAKHTSLTDEFNESDNNIYNLIV